MEQVQNEITGGALKNGHFRARVLEHDLTQSFSGSQQVEVIFELLAAAPAEDEQEEDTSVEGIKIHASLFFTENTIDRTIESLRYCGWTGEDLENLIGEGFGTKEVSLELEWQVYKGKRQLRVKWVNPLGGIKPKALESDSRRTLAALVKSRIREGAGTPEARKNRTERAPAREDARRSVSAPPAYGGQSYGDHEDNEDIPF